MKCGYPERPSLVKCNNLNSEDHEGHEGVQLLWPVFLRALRALRGKFLLTGALQKTVLCNYSGASKPYSDDRAGSLLACLRGRLDIRSTLWTAGFMPKRRPLPLTNL